MTLKLACELAQPGDVIVAEGGDYAIDCSERIRELERRIERLERQEDEARPVIPPAP